MEYMRTRSFKLAEQVIPTVDKSDYALCIVLSCNCILLITFFFLFSYSVKLVWFTLLIVNVLQFFMQAKAVCPSDPLVYNELGAVAYHMKE